MTSLPRQFQGYTSARQELAGDVLPGDAVRNDCQAFGPALHEVLQPRCSPVPSSEGLLPVSNLSISSWYAISGTAMA